MQRSFLRAPLYSLLEKQIFWSDKKSVKSRAQQRLRGLRERGRARGTWRTWKNHFLSHLSKSLFSVSLAAPLLKCCNSSCLKHGVRMPPATCRLDCVATPKFQRKMEEADFFQRGCRLPPRRRWRRGCGGRRAQPGRINDGSGWCCIVACVSVW